MSEDGTERVERWGKLNPNDTYERSEKEKKNYASLAGTLNIIIKIPHGSLLPEDENKRCPGAINANHDPVAQDENDPRAYEFRLLIAKRLSQLALAGARVAERAHQDERWKASGSPSEPELGGDVWPRKVVVEACDLGMGVDAIYEEYNAAVYIGPRLRMATYAYVGEIFVPFGAGAPTADRAGTRPAPMVQVNNAGQ